MADPAKKVVSSIAEFDEVPEVEYAEIDGFKPGTVIRIGSLNAGDVIDWQSSDGSEARRTAGLRLICRSLVDDKGNRYATDENVNVPKFRKLPNKITERIVREILKLNGMTVRGEEDAKKG